MAALSDETPTPEGPAAAARARKRRIALRKKAAASDEVIDGEEGPPLKKARAGEEDSVIDPDTDKPKPSITGIKKQSRYMPGVPMTKEELKEWRKEARRVRNRESAAASRRRNRDRIGELEGELETLNSKYAAALQYIADLEGSCSKDCFTPRILRQDLKGVRGNTGSVPCPEVTFGGTNEAFITNTAPFTFDMKENHFGNVQKKHQHIMAMISRPIACV